MLQCLTGQTVLSQGWCQAKTLVRWWKLFLRYYSGYIEAEGQIFDCITGEGPWWWAMVPQTKTTNNGPWWTISVSEAYPSMIIHVHPCPFPNMDGVSFVQTNTVLYLWYDNSIIFHDFYLLPQFQHHTTHFPFEKVVVLQGVFFHLPSSNSKKRSKKGMA